MNLSDNHIANVLDLSQLNTIRAQANESSQAAKDNALKQAAKQFEAIFMQMLLKSIRQAEDVLASDSPFNSQTTKFYRDMHDQQLAVALSENGSLGLAKLIERQLGGKDDNFTPSALLNLSHGQSLPNRVVKPLDAPATDSNAAAVEKTNEQQQENVFSTAEAFVSTLLPYASLAAQSLGVSTPVIIAQAALETGWGKKIISAKDGESSHNLFNIKADDRWSGDSVIKQTLEFDQGQMKKLPQRFRVYDSIAASVNDYVDFLTSQSRYSPALAAADNMEQFLQGLQQAGYATDPNYATKIAGLVDKVAAMIKR